MKRNSGRRVKQRPHGEEERYCDEAFLLLILFIVKKERAGERSEAGRA